MPEKDAGVSIAAARCFCNVENLFAHSLAEVHIGVKASPKALLFAYAPGR
jgi:hypothetical protein